MPIGPLPAKFPQIAMDGMQVWIYGFQGSLALLGLEALGLPSLSACLRLVAGPTGYRQASEAPIIAYRGQRRLAGSPP
jgi:hypothetical protein